MTAIPHTLESRKKFGTFPRGFAAGTMFPWPLVPAGELVELRYGKSLTEGNRRPGNIPVFGTNGRCGWHDERLAEGPGVILGRKGMGPLGVEWCESDFWVIDTAYFASPKRSDLDLKYFYYLTKYIGLNHLKDGTSNPSLSRESFYLQLLPFPSLSEQHEIARIMTDLDKKIELNIQMNQTLEAMARAIFKSWFVDFELSSGSDDWPVIDIYSIARVIYGSPFSSALFNEEGSGRPLIRIRDLTTQSPSIYTTEKHPRGKLVEPGEILVGMDGEFRARIWCGPPSWLNQRVCCFEPKPGVPRAFLLFSIEKPLAYFERSKTGTTVIHLGKADIDTFRFLLPTPEILQKFDELTGPMLERIVANEQESRTLAALRDTLLPKLLSGEIRVKQAEKIVGEAT